MPKPKKIPMRQCAGCREHKPKRELLRVVRSPEGALSLDARGKKPGRSGAARWSGRWNARSRKRSIRRWRRRWTRPGMN